MISCEKGKCLIIRNMRNNLQKDKIPQHMQLSTRRVSADSVCVLGLGKAASVTSFIPCFLLHQWKNFPSPGLEISHHDDLP